VTFKRGMTLLFCLFAINRQDVFQRGDAMRRSALKCA